MLKLPRLVPLSLMIAGVIAVAHGSDPTLKDIACRSVHLSYKSVPDSAVFYNEVRVEQSASATYFCVCGFSQGYFGIQELGDGKKVILFSVWDPGDQNDPNAVKEEQRVKLLHKHADVRVKRFGNEGTGGQSFLDYDWRQHRKFTQPAQSSASPKFRHNEGRRSG